MCEDNDQTTAMQLELTEQESGILRDLMARELGNLKEEVYKTDAAEYKARLKEREAAIRSILNKLQGESALTT
jgi:hypothetical protein